MTPQLPSESDERVTLRWAPPTGWDKYRRLLELIGGLEGDPPTSEVLAAVGLERDPRGGIGALHMASALGRCHARTGGRRRLVWRAGARPDGEQAPRLARETEYRRLLRLLNRNPRAAFPTAYLQGVAGDRSRQEVVGAMKLLVAADVVVHLVMIPWYRPYGITCWGLAHEGVTYRQRHYRGGLRPREPLSLDWEPVPGGPTLADIESARRDEQLENLMGDQW